MLQRDLWTQAGLQGLMSVRNLYLHSESKGIGFAVRIKFICVRYSIV